MLHFQAHQQLKLNVQNEEVPFSHYLQQPQRLVQAITHSSSVDQINPSHFRLTLKTLEFMMLRFQPIVDLKVWIEAGTLCLKALNCEIQGAECLQHSFKMGLTGALTTHCQGEITEVWGEAALWVSVEVPLPLTLIPAPILEKTATTFLNSILLTIKHRLERQLVQDYRRWASDSSPSSVAPVVQGSLGAL